MINDGWLMIILVTKYLHFYGLVGGIPTPLKNMKVNGKDDIAYMMENKIHVPNHQPDGYLIISDNLPPGKHTKNYEKSPCY